MIKKISIIIPAYNSGKTITKTLNSVIRQSYTNFEVLIIDDGSIDETSEIVKSYMNSDNRIRYYYQENLGVAIARNKGIEKSTGTYITFLDSDDYYNKYFLEKMLNKIIENSSDVCYCGYKISTQNGYKIKKSYFTNKNVLVNYILGKTAINTNCWMIRKDYLEKYNLIFPEKVSWGEDFELYCELLARTNKISFVNEYLTYYNLGHDPKQLSTLSLDKIDKDYELTIRIVSNKSINKNKNIENALVNYRLQGAIINRLVDAINNEFNTEEVIKYYYKYEPYIKKFSFNNGLRSLKLNINRILLIQKFK